MTECKRATRQKRTPSDQPPFEHNWQQQFWRNFLLQFDKFDASVVIVVISVLLSQMAFLLIVENYVIFVFIKFAVQVFLCFCFCLMCDFSLSKRKLLHLFLLFFSHKFSWLKFHRDEENSRQICFVKAWAFSSHRNFC